MSVGIVIVTHGESGAALLEAAEFIAGEPMSEIVFVPFRQSGDQPTGPSDLQAAMTRAETGDGVLILTDLLGSSPSNLVAEHLPADRAVMVTGLNLAMLLSVWKYRGRPLGMVARKAVESGRRGIKIFQS
jgi:PTS system ascorbate-specific IIA component